MEPTTYYLLGPHKIVRHDADYYTICIGVLADVPELDTMLDIEMIARVDYESGKLDVVAALGHPSADVPDDLAEWATTYDVERVCELTRREAADMECPS